MRLNRAVKAPPIFTHEGGPAVHIALEAQLRRSVMSCLLWEGEFYEDGKSIAARIADLAGRVSPQFLAKLAVEVRTEMHLRHVPLLLLNTLCARGSGIGGLVSSAVRDTIQRPDEITELLAIYWKDGKRPLSAQLKRGLAAALNKFNAYSLAKYNGDGAIKLRDVMFLVNPKPKDDKQAEIFRKLANNTLESPDTWEVALSGGANKRETFERLLREDKLGYMALLRNLRGMTDAGVDRKLIEAALDADKGADKVLPFRYIAAARAVPALKPAIDRALLRKIAQLAPLSEQTAILVDVSGSMSDKLSGKSDLTRMDAACALAAIAQGSLRVFSFSHTVVEVPPRRGMAGVDAIRNSQPHRGTYLGQAVARMNSMDFHRLIVITDEQSSDDVPAPLAKHAYLINVASANNGVGYRNGWKHIDGFSENIFRYIAAIESGN